MRVHASAHLATYSTSTGETPNMLMLGREIEVPLDVITEPPPDSPPLTTEYALALQQRLLRANEFTRRQKQLNARSEIMTNGRPDSV